MLGNPQNGYVCNQRAPYGATFKGSKADKCFFGGSMAPCNFSDGKTMYFFHFLVNHRVNLKDRRIRGSPSSHPQVPPLHSKWHGQTKGQLEFPAKEQAMREIWNSVHPGHFLL